MISVKKRVNLEVQQFRWSETDSAVLDIIGADTAAVVGLQTTETWQQKSAKENVSPLPTGDTASVSGVSGNENTKPKRKSTGDKEDEFMSEFKKKIRSGG